MPEVICTTVYRIDELSDAAKSRAKTWYRELGPHDDWWDAVYDDFERVCDILGVNLKTKAVRLLASRHYETPQTEVRPNEHGSISASGTRCDPAGAFAGGHAR